MASAKSKGYSGLQRLQNLQVVSITRQSGLFVGNKYRVLTPEGQLLFDMKERGLAVFPGYMRGFCMDAVDEQGSTAFKLRRPDVFFVDKFECCVKDALVSIVRKEFSFKTPLFSINCAKYEPVLRLKGDLFKYMFELQTRQKKTIGSIRKKYRGFFTELCSTSSEYTVSFPADLDVRFKVAVIASCVLVDCRYHEH